MATQPLLTKEQLEHICDEYKSYYEHWLNIALCYIGGLDFMTAVKGSILPSVHSQLFGSIRDKTDTGSGRFLKKYPQEPSALYKLRAENAYPTNDFAACINRVANLLFSTKIAVEAEPAYPAWYQDFFESADGANQSLLAMIKTVFKDAAGLYRRSGVLITKNADGKPVLSVHSNPSLRYIDFDADKVKSVVISVEQETRSFPDLPVKKQLLLVSTDTYFQTYEKTDNGDYKRTKSESVDVQPFVCFVCPWDIYMGNELIYPYLNYFNQMNRLDDAIANSCYIQHVLTSDHAIDDIQERTAGGQKNLMVLRSDEKYEQKSPEISSIKLISDHAKDLKNNFYRLVDQMAYAVDNTEFNNANRSGISKELDYSATDQLLAGYANMLADFLKRVLTQVSQIMGDVTTWDVAWDTTIPNSLEALGEVKTQGIHSPTVMKALEIQAAENILARHPELIDAAKKEIEAFYAQPQPEPTEVEPEQDEETAEPEDTDGKEESIY